MAKRLNVRENLSTIDEQPAPAPAVPAPASPSAAESAAPAAEQATQAQEPDAAQPASAGKRGGSTRTRGRLQAAGSRPSKSSASRTTTEAPAAIEESAEPAGGGGSSAAPSRPEALVPETQSDAKSLMLYLHPDDWRMLQLVKVEDNVDHQARFRAMLALYRSNARFRASVDQIGKRQPKLQGRRYGGRA